MPVFTIKTLVSGIATSLELNDTDTVAALRKRAEVALGLERKHRVVCAGQAVQDAALLSSLLSPVVLLIPVAERPKKSTAADEAVAPRAQRQPSGAANAQETVAQQVLQAVVQEVDDAAQRAAMMPEPGNGGGEEHSDSEPEPAKPAKRTRASKRPTQAPTYWWDEPTLTALSLPPELQPVDALFAKVAAVCGFLQQQRLVSTCTLVASTLSCDPRVLAEQLLVMTALAPGLMCLRECSTCAEDDEQGVSAPGTEHVIRLVDPGRVGNIRVPPAQGDELGALTEEVGRGDRELLQAGRPSVRLGTDEARPMGARGWDALSEASSERLQARQCAAFRGCCIVAARDAHKAAVADIASGDCPGVGVQYDAVVQGRWHDTVSVPTLDACVATAKQHAAAAAIAPSPRRRAKTQHSGGEYRCRSTSTLDVAAFLEHLQSDQGLGSRSQVVHVEHLPARKARTAELPQHAQLPAHVSAALARQGVTQLYTHQADAIKAALEGRHVVVSTSTASGKSVCFLAPLLARMHSQPESCALLLFPTKALAQDQLRALRLLCAFPFPNPPLTGVYDGDTPQSDRGHLRECARILFSNPDMLHCSLMPSHSSFSRFLSRLAFVVVDEAHAYRGAFGSHTALVLRRLRRLAEMHGSIPQFVFCSATIANPVHHAANLAGLHADEIVLVNDDGSPRGPKEFVLWNPPLKGSVPGKSAVDDGAKPATAPKRKSSKLAPGQRGKAAIAAALINQQGTACLEHNDTNVDGKQQRKTAPGARVDRRAEKPHRASPIYEVASLLAECVQHGLSCLAFCKTRKLSELVLMYTKDVLSDTAPALVSTLAAYRSGYTPEARRAIEHGLSTGTLKGVAATNALELGIDVGSLDVTLHLGFPGGISSLWQQAGRAGRREQRALSIYVAFDGPVDQCLFANPNALFARPPEAACVDARNPRVLAAHIGCAAFEAPITIANDVRWFGADLEAVITSLRQKALLGRSALSQSAYAYIGSETGGPSRGISLRSVEEEVWRVLDTRSRSVIEEIEQSKAFYMLYEGAILLHQSRTFLVTWMEFGERVAHVHAVDVPYYTNVVDFASVTVHAGQTGAAAYAGNTASVAHVAPCTVATRYVGYTKRWRSSGAVFDTIDMSMPEVAYESVAVWLRLPDTTRALLDGDEQRLEEGIHAAGHAVAAVLPLHVGCETGDVATECGVDGKPRMMRILLHDRLAGGAGIAQQACLVFGRLVWSAIGLLESCACESGCLSCCHDLSCRAYNGQLDKEAAALILRHVAETLFKDSRPDATL